MTQYKKGYELERQIKLYLQEQGFYVIRSSGSHGLVDLIAIGKGAVHCLQLKGGKISQKKKDALKASMTHKNKEDYYFLRNFVLNGSLKEMKQQVDQW